MVLSCVGMRLIPNTWILRRLLTTTIKTSASPPHAQQARETWIDYRFGESFADIFQYERAGDKWVRTSSSAKLEKVINTKWGDGSGSFNQRGISFITPIAMKLLVTSVISM